MVGVCPHDDDGNAAVGTSSNNAQGNRNGRNGNSHGNGTSNNARPITPQRPASQSQHQTPATQTPPPASSQAAEDDNLPMTEEQESALRRLAASLNIEIPDMSTWTQKDARRQYAALKKQKEAQAQTQSS